MLDGRILMSEKSDLKIWFVLIFYSMFLKCCFILLCGTNGPDYKRIWNVFFRIDYLSIHSNPSNSEFELSNYSESLFHPLLLPEYDDLPLPLLPLARAIALKLLALGYGRRELYTGSFPARDANLFATRFLLSPFARVFLGGPARTAISDKPLRSGPLTLLQLTRIAVRRAVGGADFARQVRRITPHIQPLLFDYVAEPSENLLFDDEVDQLPIDL